MSNSRTIFKHFLEKSLNYCFRTTRTRPSCWPLLPYPTSLVSSWRTMRERWTTQSSSPSSSRRWRRGGDIFNRPSNKIKKLLILFQPGANPPLRPPRNLLQPRRVEALPGVQGGVLTSHPLRKVNYEKGLPRIFLPHFTILK